MLKVKVKVKVKILHILTANISQMEKDSVNIAIVIKYKEVYRLSFGTFTFDLGPY